MSEATLRNNDPYRFAIMMQVGSRYGEDTQRVLSCYPFHEGSIVKYCYCISFVCLDRQYHGIGVRNTHGGMEFFDGQDQRQPVTIGSHSISVFQGRTAFKAEVCALFTNVLDFFAYVDSRSTPGRTRNLESSDYIILNDIDNLQLMMKRASRYSHLYCFFPKDDFGQTLAKTFVSLYSGHVTDCTTLMEEINKKLKAR